MKTIINRAPQMVSIPTMKKIYGILESGVVIDGVIALITRVTSQLRTVAKLTALSCMISLI